MTKRDLIPLTSLFVQPAQILFLNNAINHGIMVPLGLQQAAEAGKSILFLVEANGAIWVGTALAFAKFGTGIAKKTAPGAAVIMFFGGLLKSFSLLLNDAADHSWAYGWQYLFTNRTFTLWRRHCRATISGISVCVLHDDA